MATEIVNPRRTATILQFPTQHRRPLPSRDDQQQDARVQAIAKRAAERFHQQFGKALAPALAYEIAQAIREAPAAKD